jgi:hypothetical protein
MIRWLMIVVAMTQMAFLEPRHSKTEASFSQADQTLTLTFKVVPNEGMLITKEGPWKLILDQAEALGLQGAAGKFQSTKFDEAVPGFKVTAKTARIPSSINYELHSFICTADKTRCFPEIHKGKLTLVK